MFLSNQKGQMAIFIALFFQVLFVFFAMAINVGLVVHDKINLQNAVDIAAYYGAVRQSEILNQIGHVNYQMRQNYKLFVWRYRVLSTIGLSNHPYNNRNPNTGLLPEEDVTRPGYPQTIPPVSCVSNYYWHEYNSLDPAANLCSRADLEIPNIPPANSENTIVAGYDRLVRYTEEANRNLAKLCMESGILNWMFIARMLAHFRVDGAVRKRKIKRLAQKLSESKDLRNESIEEGVRNTLLANLTNSNASGLQNFEYFNSMESGQCSNRSFWLPEIKINPVVMFTDFEITGSNNNCKAQVTSGNNVVRGVTNRPMGGGRTVNPYTGLDYVPFGLNDSGLWTKYNEIASLQQLIGHWTAEPNTADLHSSVGFEKNPWCVVYSGVRATTSVRKPFSPFGGTVNLEAQAFAKPFGGRIGPWYGKVWPRSAPNSQATNRSQMVDALLPSRSLDGGAEGSFDPRDDLANYSRFPGDTLGLKSGRAISSMNPRFRQEIRPEGEDKIAPMSWMGYNHLGGQPTLEETGDSLARDSDTKKAVQRKFEIAAITPDWFDALYYSIEPSYFTNYFSAATTNSGAVFANDKEKIYDFGSSKQSLAAADIPLNAQFNVINQMDQQILNAYSGDIGYIVRDWEKLLTSWHQKSAIDYGVDVNRFGRCADPVTNPEYPTTGNCISGGRTGYSIKNISRDYLLSGDHSLGGANGGEGRILNPPSF